MSDDFNADAFNTVVDSRFGKMIVNRNDIYIGQAVIRYGEYSQHEFALFEYLCGAGDVVVEVGANIGAHTLGLARHVGPGGRVVAVEPQPVVFQTLCGNMAINSITNVDCLNLALSDAPGHVTVPIVDYGGQGNFGGISVHHAADVAAKAPGHKVEARRLDDVFDYPRLKLLKIDVEGMEAAVLRGAKETIAKHRPILYVENDRTDKSKALIELLFSYDYSLWWHLPPLFNAHNFNGVAANDYANIVSINMLCVHNSVNTKIELEQVEDSDAYPMRKGERPRTDEA
ncbi:MAG: FkbM family methyltransferase [Alphaproteobacteria bacterium]